MAHFVARETGEGITQEMVEALAAEAEEGYDLTQATEVRVGRPATFFAPCRSVRTPRGAA